MRVWGGRVGRRVQAGGSSERPYYVGGRESAQGAAWEAAGEHGVCCGRQVGEGRVRGSEAEDAAARRMRGHRIFGVGDCIDGGAVSLRSRASVLPEVAVDRANDERYLRCGPN